MLDAMKVCVGVCARVFVYIYIYCKERKVMNVQCKIDRQKKDERGK